MAFCSRVALLSLTVLVFIVNFGSCQEEADHSPKSWRHRGWNPENAHAPPAVNLSSHNYRSRKDDVAKNIRKHKKNWVAGVNPDFEKQNITDFRVLLGGEPVTPPQPNPGSTTINGPPGAPPGISGAPKRHKTKRRRYPPRRGNGTEPDKKGNGRWKRAIPDMYDARTDYPECKSIDSIRYQYHCSSCYAVQTASLMSDRHCIYNYNKTGQIYISSYHLLSCVEHGCDGGKEWDAFDYWIQNGLVSGGTAYQQANEPDGCLPYPNALSQTPDTCPTKCSNTGYATSFDTDKSYGGDYDTMWSPSVQDMQNEILTYGPVIAFFTVYEDFFLYKSGVYEYVSGNVAGYHNAKLIGWGTEGGVDYWLGVNTWGVNWGQQGIFKIRRGANTCGIEERVSWVLPKEAVHA